MRRGIGILVVAALAALVLLYLAGRMPEVTVRVVDLPARAEQVLPYQTGDREGALVVSWVERSGPGPEVRATWGESFDLATGQPVARRPVRGLATCYGVLRDRLWCWTDELGLQVRRMPELTLQSSQLDLINRFPALAGVLRDKPGDFGIDNRGRVVLSSNDGRFWVLEGDPERLVGPMNPEAVGPPLSNPLVKVARYATPVTLEGAGDRARVSFDGRLSNQEFFQPRLLEDLLSRRGVWFETPPGVLIAHFTRRDASGSWLGLGLSRVGADGATAWTFHPHGPLGADDRPEEHVLALWTTSRGVFLAVRMGLSTTLFLLDPATGQPRWTRAVR